MVFYDAVCTAREARELIPRVAEKMSQNAQSVDSVVHEEREQTSKVISRRALGLLKLLAQKRCEHLIRQLASPSVSTSFSADFSGIVLQLIKSSRWQKKYGKHVYDIVIATPEFVKTIALSTTEILTKVPVDQFQICDRLTLSNFHVYPFFNRAHAVRGRKASHVDVGTRLHDLSKLKFLLRTSLHAKIIGTSHRLSMFTPLDTLEGFRLGFYFATICKATKVKSVRGAGGYGFDLSQSEIDFEDEYGALRARMSVEVFRRSVEDNIQRQWTLGIGDLRDLEGYRGWLLVIAVWFFADTLPYVAFLGFLGNDPAIRRYSTLAYANSVRKMRASDFSSRFGSFQELPLTNMMHIDDCVYYKEDVWPDNLFKVLIESKMKNLSFSEALRFKIRLSEYQEFCVKMRRLFEMRNDLETLYFSENPEEDFARIFEG
jgi:hypothetical protein